MSNLKQRAGIPAFIVSVDEKTERIHRVVAMFTKSSNYRTMTSGQIYSLSLPCVVLKDEKEIEALGEIVVNLYKFIIKNDSSPSNSIVMKEAIYKNKAKIVFSSIYFKENNTVMYVLNIAAI